MNPTKVVDLFQFPLHVGIGVVDLATHLQNIHAMKVYQWKKKKKQSRKMQ